MANIFELFGKIVVDNSEANKAISDTSSKASQFASAMKKGITDAAKWGAGITTAATAAAVAIGNQIKKIVNDAASMADTIDKASDRIGFSTQAYQEWEYVLTLCGTSAESLESGMKALQEKMYSVNTGSTEAIRLFNELGISCFDMNGEMKDAEVIFEEVIYKLAQMTNESERTQLAQKLFSEGGVKFANMLNQGTAGIDAMRESFRELGIEMSEEDIAAGALYTDTTYMLSRAVDSIKNDLGMTVMPYLTELAEKLLEKIPAIKEKLSEWEPAIQNTLDKIVSGLEWIIDNPEEVGKALETIGAGFVILMGIIKPIETAIVLIGAGIIGLAKTFGGGNTETEKFEKTMSELDETFVQTMRDIEDEYIEANTLMGVIENLGSKTGLTADETARWEAAVNRMNEIIPGFKDLINEETGEIQGGTDAIYARIEAMKAEAQAEAATKYLKGKYDAVTAAYGSSGKLQLDIETYKALLESKYPALMAANTKYKELEAALDALEGDNTAEGRAKRQELTSELVNARHEAGELGAEYREIEKELRNAQEDLESLLPEIKKAEEELAAAEKAINGGAEGLENTLNAAAEALEGAAEALENTEVIPALSEFAENEMQKELNDMDLTVSVTPNVSGSFFGSGANFLRERVNDALGGLPGHADGLDYVPFDNYVARLHKGEKVLTANEASAYRSGEGNSRVENAVNRLYSIMADVLTAIREGQVIQLDTGALVGQTAGAMNNQLGALAVRSGRRN